MFLPSDETWQKKRRAVSVAFYKEKMRLMGDSMIRLLGQRLDHWEEIYAKTNTPFDIIEEIGDI